LKRQGGNNFLSITDFQSSFVDYTYNAENQLTRINFPDLTFAEYAYDGLGRRIQKDVNGTITRYVYDNEDILLEYDATDTVRARYTHGPGIDEPLTLERDTDLDGTLETTLHTLQDGLGSITALVDATGAILETYEYESFGQVTIKDNLGNPIPESAFGNPYTYTGREYDPESGLYFFVPGTMIQGQGGSCRRILFRLVGMPIFTPT